MINYFYKNKGHMKICEDSLTATTFDLLKYLPNEIFWRIVRNSLYQDKLPKISGDLLQISFWERWNPDGTTNSRFVEPDVFIRFEEFDVIIEAKRYDNNQQYAEQMGKEIIAYFNEYEDEYRTTKKQLYFIQCGGLNSKDNEQNYVHKDNEVIICKTDWTRLLNQIVYEKKIFNEVYLSQINSYKRIFDDLINGFEMHGFYRIIWLDTLKSINIENYNNLKLFDYV